MTMEIGARLRELREGKGLSQGHIEKRTGLLRCYISRVECGYTVPSIETIEKWAGALGLELYQVFFSGKGTPVAAKGKEIPPLGPTERGLLRVLPEVTPQDRALLLSLAHEMARRKRENR
jgi:transcriptional regulator with XRE-family HTH domain